MAATVSAPCTQHPARAAGWSCLHCDARLCEDCAAIRSGGVGVDYLVCCLCRGAAQPLRVPRAELDYADWLKKAWRYPLHSSGLITMVGAGLLLYILAKLHWLSAGVPGVAYRFPLGAGLIWGYTFSLIRQVGNGSLELDPPDFSDWSDLAGPAFRGFIATTLLWAPMLVFLLCLVATSAPIALPAPAAVAPAAAVAPVEDSPDTIAAERTKSNDDVQKILAAYQAQVGAGARSAEPSAPSGSLTVREGLRRPHPRRIWLILLAASAVGLLGLLLVPMSLLMAATGSPWYQLVNPVFLVGYIRRIPRDYLLAVGAVWAAYLAQYLMGKWGVWMERLPIPVLPGLLASIVRVYPELVIAYILGSLLYLRGTQLGAFGPEDAFIPALPGAVPHGVLPENAVGAYTEEAPPEPGLAAAESRPPRKRVLEVSDLSPEKDFKREGSFFAVDEPLGARIAKAIAESNRAMALNLYRTSRGELSQLTSLDHFNVGRLAAGEADYPLAVRALEQAAANREDPLAARALVVLARLLGERMNDAAGAERIYKEVMDSYPGSEGALFAAKQLKPLPR